MAGCDLEGVDVTARLVVAFLVGRHDEFPSMQAETGSFEEGQLILHGIVQCNKKVRKWAK
jgi:hypothetical protein